MTRIDNLFAQSVELAEADAPPSPLRAAQLFRAGRRRRTRMTAILAAMSVALATGAVGAIAAIATGASPNPTPNPTPKVPEPAGPVRWAGTGDRDHLYVLSNDCYPTAANNIDPLTCPPDRLLASVDGGRTWTTRALPATHVEVVAVLGTEVLQAQALVSSADPVLPRQLSVDGGRHWAQLQESNEPLATVPAGSSPVAWFFQPADTPIAVRPGQVVTLTADSRSYQVAAVDQTTGTIRPLEHQPPLRWLRVSTSPAEHGIWASGYDPTTRRPAVSVSRDAGRTWQTTVLADAPVPVTLDAFPGSAPDVDTADGQIVYATVQVHNDADPYVVFCSLDGGLTWQKGDPTNQITAGVDTTIALPDNRHLAISVLGTDSGPAVHYLAATGTGPYRDIAAPPSLWAGAATSILPMPGGGYLTTDAAGVYLSDDGLIWHRVWPSG